MLCLTRKEGDCVKIGEDVTVYVGEIKEGRVKLRFDCPRSIDIARGELLAKEAHKVLAGRVCQDCRRELDFEEPTNHPVSCHECRVGGEPLKEA